MKILINVQFLDDF